MTSLDRLAKSARKWVGPPEPAASSTEPEPVALWQPVSLTSRPARVHIQVGAADDASEIEADRAARDVIAVLQARHQTGAGTGKHSLGQSSSGHLHAAGSATPTPDAAAGSAAIARLRRHARTADDGVVGAPGGQLGAAAAQRLDRSRQGGRPLAEPLRALMESAFDADFSNVRIHTDADADSVAHAIQAEAFTQGSDVYFAADAYRPGAPDGQYALAHELSHVVQGGATGRSQAGAERSSGTDRDAGVHRLFSMTAADINAARVKRGAIKGQLVRDTLYRLGQMLTDYRKARRSGKQLLLIDGILGLADSFLEKHGGDQERSSEIEIVEEIQLEAERERGRVRAQVQYLSDAYGTSAPTRGGTNTNLALQKRDDTYKVHAGAKALGKSKTTSEVLGADKSTLDLVKKHGLTEAEILALRTYTAADYEYINPAAANAPDWMAGQNFTDEQKAAVAADLNDDKDTKAEKERQKLALLKPFFEEGSLHTGVAMMGLEKLPVKAGTTYRGMRMTKEKFENDFEGKSTYPYGAFASTAVVRDRAQHFADGGGNVPPARGQTTSVMCILKVINGRDMRKLSIYGAGEQEWLLLPGATFSIDRVVEQPTGNRGNTPYATRWFEVYMTQLK